MDISGTGFLVSVRSYVRKTSVQAARTNSEGLVRTAASAPSRHSTRTVDFLRSLTTKIVSDFAFRMLHSAPSTHRYHSVLVDA